MTEALGMIETKSFPAMVEAADAMVKAAGGIRTYDDAQKMIAAGASRIGASASVKIMQEAVK